MNGQEYKLLKAQGDVLDFATLDSTRRIVEQRGQADLADGITHTLSNGKFDKPLLHAGQHEQHTNFYRIALGDAEIERIISVLFDLEAEAAVAEDDASAVHYATLVDQWHTLMEQRRAK